MRYPSIDLLRTIAIALMVIVHFVENLSGPGPYRWLPAGFAAPIFTFLTGLSCRLWIEQLKRRGVPAKVISQRTVRRGLFLLGVGFAFNLFVWMPEDIWNWDVLTFVGAAWLFLALAGQLPEAVTLSICVTTFIIAPALRVAADFPAYWSNGYFDCDLKLSEVLLGFLVTGYFPFFPWIILPLVGYRVGAWLGDSHEAPAGLLRQLGIWGAGLMAAGGLCLWLRERAPLSLQQNLLQGWSMFPPSPAYLLTTLGFTLLALAVTRQWIDLNPRLQGDNRLIALCSTFSRHAFTMYLLHHLVHLWPLWIYSLARGHEATHYWQSALPVAVSLPLAPVFLVASYVLLRWMDRAGIPSVESWMRWVCD